MSLQRSPQSKHSNFSSESEQMIDLRTKYHLILGVMKGWVKNIPHPVDENDAAILGVLEGQLGRYGDIPVAYQSIEKYVKLIEEITNPKGEIHNQIVLMRLKPRAEELLVYLDEAYNSISARLHPLSGRSSMDTLLLESSLHKAEEEALAWKAEAKALVTKLDEELAKRVAAELLVTKLDEELAKKVAAELLATKLDEEALARKREAEEALARKREEEEALASKREAEEALAVKLQEELVARKTEEKALNLAEESVLRKEEEAPIKRVLHKAEVKAHKAGEGAAEARPAEEVMENIESLRHAIEKDFKSFDPSHSATNAKFIGRPVQGEKTTLFPILNKIGGHYVWKEMTIGAYREEALSRSKNTKVSPNEVEMSVAHAVGFQEYLRIKNFFQDDGVQIVSAIRAIPSKENNTKTAKIALETAYIEATMSHLNIDGINITYNSKNGTKSHIVTKNLRDFLRSNVEEACKFLAHDIFHDSSVVLAHLEHSIDVMGSVMAGMREIDMSNITFNSHL